MLNAISTLASKWALSVLGLALVFSAVAGSAHAQTCAPEIDPGSMAGALTLLTGGVLLLTDRLRRKK